MQFQQGELSFEPAMQNSGYVAEVKDKEFTGGNSRQEFEYVILGSELIENAPESIEFLLEPLLPKAGIGFLVGPSDSNKSTFLRQLALAVFAFVGVTALACKRQSISVAVVVSFDPQPKLYRLELLLQKEFFCH